MEKHLQKIFGNIDIYLFDQLLKGRFDLCSSVLDAGCGDGRNLWYFLQDNNFKVSGVDVNPEAISFVSELSSSLSTSHSSNHFQVAQVEHLPFQDKHFDLVISSAVLHFAQDRKQFEAMLFEMWRVLKTEGYLFIRLASNIGIESLVHPLGNGRYLLPDGSQRYLVNEQAILAYTRTLNAVLFEPLKTTNVQNLRCMTTWCLQK